MRGRCGSEKASLRGKGGRGEGERGKEGEFTDKYLHVRN